MTIRKNIYIKMNAVITMEFCVPEVILKWTNNFEENECNKLKKKQKQNGILPVFIVICPC